MGRFLTPREADIWQRFASTLQPPPNEIHFETPILKLVPGAKYTQKLDLDWWERITALKIDVLWEYTNGYHLAEIEETLTMESIGQALCYRELWNEINPKTPITRALVITAGHDERLVPGLKAAGLEHYLVNVL